MESRHAMPFTFRASSRQMTPTIPLVASLGAVACAAPRRDCGNLRHYPHCGRLQGSAEDRAGYGRHRFAMPAHGQCDVVVADEPSGGRQAAINKVEKPRQVPARLPPVEACALPRFFPLQVGGQARLESPYRSIRAKGRTLGLAAT